MMALTDCQIGETARVVGIDAGKRRLAKRLSVFGVDRGAKVRLLQKEKTCVIDCNDLEFAVDATIADAIQVEKL